MNKVQQFWTLLRFQISALTVAVFITWPLMFSMCYWIFFHNTPITLAHYLGWLLSGNSWFFVPLIGSVLLAPELYLFGSAIFSQNSGTEFLLTRAVDRPLLLRVRSILFYGLVLVIPCILFLGTLKSPQLQLKEFDQRISHLILSQIPGRLCPNWKLASLVLPLHGHRHSDIPLSHLLTEVSEVSILGRLFGPDVRSVANSEPYSERDSFVLFLPQQRDPLHPLRFSSTPLLADRHHRIDSGPTLVREPLFPNGAVEFRVTESRNHCHRPLKHSCGGNPFLPRARIGKGQHGLPVMLRTIVPDLLASASQ